MFPLNRSIPAIAICGFAALLAGCASADRFAKLDTNRDKSGSPAEFDAYMKQEVFARIDVNNDGKITKPELQQFNPEVDNAKFRSKDLNRDGFIARQEADAAFDREGSLKRLFTVIDTDRNGSLSREEASAFRSKVQQQPGNSPARKISNATKTS